MFMETTGTDILGIAAERVENPMGEEGTQRGLSFVQWGSVDQNMMEQGIYDTQPFREPAGKRRVAL